MAISRFASVTIINPPPGARDYGLNFRLPKEDIHRFTDFTQKLANAPGPRNQMAVIVNGVVLLHPYLPAAIPVGVFQIGTGDSRAQAQALLHKLEHP
jgi:hypothetical protein